MTYLWSLIPIIILVVIIADDLKNCPDDLRRALLEIKGLYHRIFKK